MNCLISWAFRLWGSLCLALVFCHSVCDAKQIVHWAFDWDNNVMTLPTQLFLYEKTNTGYIEHPFTTEGFALVRDKLGKPGPFENYEFHEFPLYEGSVRNFLDDPTGQTNHFYNDMLIAVRSGKPETWQGPMWPIFRLLKTYSVITSRGHSKETFKYGLSLLKQSGIVDVIPDEESFFLVSDPKDPTFGKMSKSQAKTLYMEKELDRIQAISLEPSDAYVTSRNGSYKQKSHVWIFSDDDISNFETAREVLSKKVAQGLWPKVKIILIFTGLNHASVAPQAIALKASGQARALFSGELEEALALSVGQFVDPASFAWNPCKTNLVK